MWTSEFLNEAALISYLLEANIRKLGFTKKFGSRM